MMTACGDPAPGPVGHDQDPDVRADAGGWISGPGLDVPGDQPASVSEEPGGAAQGPNRLTIAR